MPFIIKSRYHKTSIYLSLIGISLLRAFSPPSSSSSSTHRKPSSSSSEWSPRHRQAAIGALLPSSTLYCFALATFNFMALPPRFIICHHHHHHHLMLSSPSFAPSLRHTLVISWLRHAIEAGCHAAIRHLLPRHVHAGFTYSPLR